MPNILISDFTIVKSNMVSEGKMFEPQKWLRYFSECDQNFHYLSDFSTRFGWDISEQKFSDEFLSRI